MRGRKCKACGHAFRTYESYEKADPEASFELSDMQKDVALVYHWLIGPARHIPIVRDVRIKLRKYVTPSP